MILCLDNHNIDPRPNRWSLFSRMVSVRTSVRPSQKQKRATTLELVPRKQNATTLHATTDTTCEYIDRLLAVAWWVILNSPDLLYIFIW